MPNSFPFIYTNTKWLANLKTRWNDDVTRPSLVLALLLPIMTLVLFIATVVNHVLSRNPDNTLETATITVFLAGIAEWFRQKVGARTDFKNALELFNKVHDTNRSSTAVYLLDYESYIVDFPAIGNLREEQMLVARSIALQCLRVSEQTVILTEREFYLRDCFDSCFVRITELSLIYKRGFLTLDEIDSIFGIILARIRGDAETWKACEAFLMAFNYHEVIYLINKFWQNRRDVYLTSPTATASVVSAYCKIFEP